MASAFAFAVVTSASPLTVQLDGDPVTDDVPVRDYFGLSPSEGDRVYLELATPPAAPILRSVLS
jgi:hypothetical protein